MHLKQWLLAGAVLLAGSGCCSNEILVKKQTEMEARMEQLIQANAGNVTQLAEQALAIRELQAQVKTNGADLDVLKTGSRDMKSSQEDISRQGDVKSSLPQSSRVVVVNKGGVPGESGPAEQSEYLQAFGLFSSNNYGGAVEAFETFIRSHPGSEYAGNAQYWIGECYYSQRDYTRALDSFSKVISNYPKGSKVPDALLKVGYSQISLNQADKARATLETLVEKYPQPCCCKGTGTAEPLTVIEKPARCL